MNASPTLSDTGEVITVTGPISPELLGITLTHEHILIDLSAYFQPDPDPVIAAELSGPLHIGMLGNLRRSLANCADDLALDDDQLAVRELARFKRRGGRTVCELSSLGIRVPRHGPRLRDISRSTGLQIVMGTGAYVGAFHPTWVQHDAEARVAERFITELRDGADGVRCGIIGEIGLSAPPLPDEWKVLGAAATAHLATGAAIVLHQRDLTLETPWRALDVLEDRGVRPDRVVIAHATLCNFDRLVEAMRRGAYVALDTTGIHGCVGELDMPGENWYAHHARRLADHGRVDRLLLSHDVAHKRSLREYGGCGYDHLLATLLPKLVAVGFRDQEITQILETNAKDLLAIGL